MPSLTKLARRAAKFARSQVSGEPKEKRIASAKREFELQLRASGFSREQAKHAVRVRFNPDQNE